MLSCIAELQFHPLQLLEAIAPLKRGLAASDEQKADVDRLASKLERLNPTKKPLASDLVNGAQRGLLAGWLDGATARFLWCRSHPLFHASCR